jgi:hypothetical protein
MHFQRAFSLKPGFLQIYVIIDFFNKFTILSIFLKKRQKNAVFVPHQNPGATSKNLSKNR